MALRLGWFVKPVGKMYEDAIIVECPSETNAILSERNGEIQIRTLNGRMAVAVPVVKWMRDRDPETAAYRVAMALMGLRPDYDLNFKGAVLTKNEVSAAAQDAF